MSRKAFKEGDLVWAKMRGHPHWPAKVERCPKGQSRPPGKLWVFFYGTHEHAWMLSAELCCYEENREKFRLPKKIKGFAEAIWEIEEDPDLVITLGKPPSRKRRRSALAKRGSHGNEDCHDGVVQDKVKCHLRENNFYVIPVMLLLAQTYCHILLIAHHHPHTIASSHCHTITASYSHAVFLSSGFICCSQCTTCL
jgi:hepatoma-derived growth factor